MKDSAPSGCSGLVLGPFAYFAFDRLAGHLRGRRVGFFALAHAILEPADRAAEIRAHVAQLLRAEDQHYDQQDDQPVPDAERTHSVSPIFCLAASGPGVRARLERAYGHDTPPDARPAPC